MDKKKVSGRNLLKIFFIFGIVLTNTRFENFSYQEEEYSYNLAEAFTELVINEGSNGNSNYSSLKQQCYNSILLTVSADRLNHYKYANRSYNVLVLILPKTLIPKSAYHSKLISIIQKYNNFHSYFEAEPPIAV